MPWRAKWSPARSTRASISICRSLGACFSITRSNTVRTARTSDDRSRCLPGWRCWSPSEWREHVDSFLRYARAHQEVIERFGRFPHRNAVLGRESTSAGTGVACDPWRLLSHRLPETETLIVPGRYPTPPPAPVPQNPEAGGPNAMGRSARRCRRSADSRSTIRSGCLPGR